MLGVVTAFVLFGSVVLSAPSVNTTITFIGVLGLVGVWAVGQGFWIAINQFAVSW